MTQRFIIDENVAILAQKGENDRGEEDNTCRQLLDSIIEICHSMVFDLVLWDKFYRQLRNLPPDQPFGPRSLLRILHLALERGDKIQNIGEEAQGFPEEGDIPRGSKDDVYLVRLAIVTEATLVTTDTRLREDLASSGVEGRYNLSVVSPQEALGLLGRT